MPSTRPWYPHKWKYEVNRFSILHTELIRSLVNLSRPNYERLISPDDHEDYHRTVRSLRDAILAIWAAQPRILRHPRTGKVDKSFFTRECPYEDVRLIIDRLGAEDWLAAYPNP